MSSVKHPEEFPENLISTEIIEDESGSLVREWLNWPEEKSELVKEDFELQAVNMTLKCSDGSERILPFGALFQYKIGNRTVTIRNVPDTETNDNGSRQHAF